MRRCQRSEPAPRPVAVEDPSPRGRRLPVTLATCIALCSAAGCHDGPMYALKQANPYYSMHEWEADERLGPTDAQRAEELTSVVDAMPHWDTETQQRWLGELENILRYDESPYMRAMAVQAAGKSQLAEAVNLLAKGLEDDDAKVRLTAAKSLGPRTEPEATRLLAKTVSGDANKDVRLTAIKSLGSHRGPEAITALRMGLKESELAYQRASMDSLRSVTGRNAGDDPDAWIAMLDAVEIESDATPERLTWGQRLRELF